MLQKFVYKKLLASDKDIENLSKEELTRAYQELCGRYEQLQENITSFVKTQDQSEESVVQHPEKEMAQWLNTIPDMALSINRNHEVTLTNEACTAHFLQLYQVYVEPGDNLDHIFSKDEQAFWHPLFDASFQGFSMKSIVEKTIDGKEVFLETMLYPIREGQGGEVEKIGVICRDITENHLNEQAIRESEKNLSDAHRIAQSGSWEYHIDTSLVVLNKETISLFGVPGPEDKITLPLEQVLIDFIYPSDQLFFIAKLKRATSFKNKPDQYHDQFEYKFIRPDGELRHLVLYSRFKNNNPNIIYGVTQDITEQKRTQQRLVEQNKELTKVNSEIDRFVYRVSHDLRAPVTSILGLINIARQESSIDNIKTYLDLQEKSIKKMDNFIQEIIDFSKNSRLEVSHDAINFRELVNDVFEAQDFEANIQTVLCQSHVHQHQPFISDRSRLQTILNNLVINAIRYANLKQQRPYVRVIIRVFPKEALIIVKDNGIGIRDEHQHRVFNMFYRANSNNPGSGLGLYIVKETIKKLNANIELTSRHGHWTYLTMTIPNLAR